MSGKSSPPWPGGTPEVHLHNLLTVLLQGEEELKRAAQPRLALEVLLLKLIHLEPVLPLATWLARLESLEQRLEAGPRVAAESARRGASAAVRRVPVPGSRRPPSPASREDAAFRRSGRPFCSTSRSRKAGPCTASSPNAAWWA